MDRQTDRGSDRKRRVIGCYPTNGEHPITLENKKIVCILHLLSLKEVLNLATRKIISAYILWLEY